MYQLYFSPPILSLRYKSLNFLLLSNIFNENMSVCQSCLPTVRPSVYYYKSSKYLHWVSKQYVRNQCLPYKNNHHHLIF